MKYSNINLIKKIVVFACLVFSVSVFAQSRIYTLKNDGIERDIEVGKTVSTVKLTNLFTNKSFDVQSDEFKIMIDDYNADFSGPVLTNKDFRVSGKIISAKDSLLSIPLVNDKYGIKITLNYTADGKFYMHKWLDFETLNSKHNISTVEVERFIIEGAKAVRPMPEDDGNTPNDGPVYADNFFLGLEFPKQDNSFDGEYIRLKHFPGKTIKPGEKMSSKKSVLGASPDTPLHRLKDSFLKYISEYRSTKVRNYKVYNTWFLLVFDQTEDKLLNAIKTHVKPLYDRGIKLDGFVVDDGWQDRNTFWKVDHKNIPDGIGPESKIQFELHKYNCNLNLWMPLSGQYGLGERRKEDEFYKKLGYETGTNWSLCLAPGNKVFKAKKARILELAKEGVTSFKADFAFLGCDKKGHHHLPNKYYGMEANVNGIIDIINSVRKINPNMFYYLTTAINKSPWWLNTNDILWESNGGDIKTYSGNSEPTDALQRMSGRDEWHYQHNMRWFVPQTSYMTHGIIGGNSDYNGLYASLQQFIDNAILYYARGVMWSEIYVTTMDDTYWDALADVIKWSDRNWDILTQEPALSGGPSEHKPYYWAHFKGDNGLIILRNPTASERGIKIPLDETSRMPEHKGERYKAEVIKVSNLSNVKPKVLGYYSYNDVISTTIKPWEVIVVKVSPDPVEEKIINLSTNEINFGRINVGQKLDTVITLSGSKEKVSLESSPVKWLNVTSMGNNKFEIKVNTGELNFTTVYQTALKVKSNYEPYDRKVIVYLKTGLDPNAKEIYLSDIDFKSHRQAWGNLGKDKSVGGKSISIAGKKYSKGLGTHANSSTVYSLSNLNVKKFQANVGADDETSGSVEFFVYLNNGNGFGDAVFSSGLMKKGDTAKFVNLDIAEAKEIKLVVKNGGDGINGDHADWADAKFLR